MVIAIVDDLEQDRLQLQRLVTDCCAQKRLACRCLLYTGGEELLAAWRPGLCDAVFLDILMGGITGLETAARLRLLDENVPIIFTTAEASYALQGYSVHPLDYLLKPVQAEKLQWCMDRLALQAPPRQETIEVRQADGRGAYRTVQLLPKDILYIRAEGHSVVLHTAADAVRTRSTFGQVLALLPQNGHFCECGRGIAVNFAHCAGVEKGVIRLKNKESLPFSGRQQEAVEQAWMRYMFSRTRMGGG